MANITKFQEAMLILLATFRKYAGAPGDKDKNTLTKAEFKAMLDAELPICGKGEEGKNFFDRMMEDLDANKDQRIDFQEYMILVAGLTMAMHDMTNE
ncbi:protein S100-A6-like [Hippoglossus stenolepis]|uniref:protein S100-A6-like n=1 Tax=Hippoglossus stenolepis TaxID=195615 RepID=UPI001FAF1FCE|nr:protein S100-A6-like [Hippoglossus stenolepis]